MKRVTVYISLVLLFLFVGISEVQPAYAGFDKGWYALMTRDYKTALSEFKPLAMQGNALAQKNLGWMYFTGAGVIKNYAEAFKWYRKAADQELAEAQYALGEMYHKGYGVPVDVSQAMIWYRKAADQGNVSAQYSLGRIFYTGRIVPRDYMTAHKFFDLAASQGLEKAVKSRTMVEGKMNLKRIANVTNNDVVLEQPSKQIAANSKDKLNVGEGATTANKRIEMLRKFNKMLAASNPGSKTKNLWAVNVVSVRSKSDAGNFIDKLKNGSYKAYITEFDKDNTHWYRVRIGFFPDKQKAEMTGRDILKKYQFKKYWVVKPSNREILANR